MSKHNESSMAPARTSHGTVKPPSRSASAPKSGGHAVTPNDEMARPSPTAVPD